MLEPGLVGGWAGDDEAYEDRPPVELVLPDEGSSTGRIERAEHRRGKQSVAKAGIVEAPLPGLWIVEPERAAFDRAALAMEAGGNPKDYRAVLVALLDGLMSAPSE